jgi:hypothetical protein
MTMRRVLAMTVLVLGFGVTAHAATLAAGPMFGGPSQTIATCYLFNAGTEPVIVVTNQILREGSPASNRSLAPDLCGETLAPNSSCAIQANIDNLAAHICKFTVSPSAATVRGGFEVRAGNVVLKRADLR